MIATTVHPAARRRAVLRARIAAPEKSPETVSDVIDLWLKSEEVKIKITSLSTYKIYIKSLIRPAIGGIPARELTEEDVRRLLARIAAPEQGYARKTVQLAANILKQILSFGRGRGMGVDPAVCSGCAKPVRQRTANSLTGEEQQRLLAALDGSLMDMGVLLSLKTGLRIGEVVGLKWGDIDFEGGFLRVCRTVSRIYGEEGHSAVYVGEPKSESSRRVVPLSAGVMTLLAARRQEKNVFLTSGTEKPHEPASLRNHFGVVLRRARIRQVNFHVLRHTFATQCVEKGFEVKSLSMILGHSDVSTTLNTYVHPSMEKLRSMMERVD